MRQPPWFQIWQGVLLYFFEDMPNKLDNKKPVEIIYLDFEKVLDKVLHKCLIAKLESHGINGNICKWVAQLQ